MFVTSALVLGLKSGPGVALIPLLFVTDRKSGTILWALSTGTRNWNK